MGRHLNGIKSRNETAPLTLLLTAMIKDTKIIS
jgi:hypothetical protein